jgi:hypothetical protein
VCWCAGQAAVLVSLTHLLPGVLGISSPAERGVQGNVAETRQYRTVGSWAYKEGGEVCARAHLLLTLWLARICNNPCKQGLYALRWMIRCCAHKMHRKPMHWSNKQPQQLGHSNEPAGRWSQTAAGVSAASRGVGLGAWPLILAA